MRKLTLISSIAFSLLLFACAEDPKKEKDNGPELKVRKKSETPDKPEEIVVPVDLSNKGIGPFADRNYKFSENINPEMAAAGEKLFLEKICNSCHMPKQRMIGPALSGVYERRSPEWVLNMIINPTQMIKEDPIGKALLKEYNGAQMTQLPITEKEAMEIAEYLRTL